MKRRLQTKANCEAAVDFLVVSEIAPQAVAVAADQGVDEGRAVADLCTGLREVFAV